MQYGGAGSDTINAARDADGFTAIMQVGWFGSSIDNMILLMEDILPNLLKTCESLDIYSLARNDLTGAGCPSRGGPIKMAEVAVPCVPSDRPIISELPILSIFPTGWEVQIQCYLSFF